MAIFQFATLVYRHRPHLSRVGLAAHGAVLQFCSSWRWKISKVFQVLGIQPQKNAGCNDEIMWIEFGK